jgi:hypothetical protein
MSRRLRFSDQLISLILRLPHTSYMLPVHPSPFNHTHNNRRRLNTFNLLIMCHSRPPVIFSLSLSLLDPSRSTLLSIPL